MLSNQDDYFPLLNSSIMSTNKNLDKLKMCMKTISHKFTAIGLSETHLADKPLEYFHLPSYNLEYMNWVGSIGVNPGGIGDISPNIWPGGWPM